MKKNRDKLHLELMLESIEQINRHIDGYNLDRFVVDDKTFDAVLMQFINIGEMINRLSEDFREEHSYFLWHQPIGLRNEIVHGYLKIKRDVVWDTTQKDLPALKEQIKKILNNQ